MKNKTMGIRTQALIIISVLLLAANIALGIILMEQSRTATKAMMQARMLDVVNTAASMIDGDAYEQLHPADRNSEEYRKVYDFLVSFMHNTTMKYVYGIRKENNGRFIFTVDPAPENARIFGEYVTTNDALWKAALGIAAVCEEPYEDDYGKFYTAYSPILNSSGKIVGFVAADLDAKWYEDQISKSANTILAGCLISLLIGALIVVIATSRLRRRFLELNFQMRELAVDVNSFTRKVTGVSSGEIVTNSLDADGSVLDAERRSYDEIQELGTQISNMRTSLQAYIDKVQALAYTDALTGVKSKQSYVEAEEKLNRQISECSVQNFAVVSCDINGLKETNDTKGHVAGNELIKSACRLICDYYSHSPVFRIGGDEFEVILQGRDYKERYKILRDFNQKVEQHLEEGKVVVSAGMSDYIPGQDKNLQDVFVRADEDMYVRKNKLKSMGAGGR